MQQDPKPEVTPTDEKKIGLVKVLVTVGLALWYLFKKNKLKKREQDNTIENL